MANASDEALLAGLAGGDPDAALALVRRYQRRVFGLAFAVLADVGQAEDVAQEAFCRAWRHAGTYDGRRGSVATWLLAITRNLAIDVVRVRRLPSVPGEALLLQVPSAGRDPAEEAVASDDAARLREALGRLPVEQRRALVLASIGGRTAEEVSVVEGIPLGTAKTRIRTAMGKLRTDLERERQRDEA